MKIVIKARVLRTGLKGIIKARGKKDKPSRYNISGLKFEITDWELKLIATDGVRLSVATMECSTQASGDILINNIEEVFEILKKKPIKDDLTASVTIETDDKTATFTCQKWSASCPILNKDFPDFERVIPNPGQYATRACRVNVDPRLLAEVFKNCVGDRNNKPARLNLFEEGGGFMVETSFDDVEFTHIVMPCKPSAEWESDDVQGHKHK